MSFSIRDPDVLPAWQQRALHRSLAAARTRSVVRLHLFVDAARQLAAETGDASFTVQQVVQRSGQSLKSFYRYFEGKDGLLLALIEEDTRIGAQALTEWIARHDDPLDRLHGFVSGLLGFLAMGEATYVGMLISEQRRLEQADPDGMTAALAPFTDLLESLLADAGSAGQIRPGDCRRDAATLFNLVMHQLQALGPGAGRAEAEEAADYLWSFCTTGLASETSNGTAR
jgi:AcrR family transcriptional regulator